MKRFNARARYASVALFGAIWCFWALALDPARAVTQYGLQAWTTAQGLPSNAVNAVLQSRDGYLWLGTEDGLVRFDGLQFTLFNNRTTPAFKVNAITGLVESLDGALWAATNGGGVVRYRNGTFDRFGREAGMPDERVWSMCGDGGDGVWVGTPASVLIRIEGGRVRTEAEGHFPGGLGVILRAPSGGSGVENQGDGLWVSHGAHLELYQKGHFSTVVRPRSFAEGSVRALLYDRSGRLWVGTDVGVVRMGPGGHRVFTTREGLLDNRIFFLSEDRDGNAWIGSYGGGLARVTADDRVEVLTAAKGLADDRPLCFFEDREGNAWVGTRGGGLNRLTDGPATAFTTVEGLTSDQVYPVLEDRAGALWLGTAGGGLNRIEGDRIMTFGAREGLSSDRVYALCQDRAGTVWAGTADGALNRFDGRRFHTVNFQTGAGRHRIACITEDPLGRLWVGTRGGGLWVGERGRFKQASSGNEPPGWGIYAIFVKRDGTIWLGTSEGLYRLAGNHFVPFFQEPDIGHEKVFGICEDARGSLWMATYGGGLVRVRNGRARRITGTDGLGSSTFYQVLEDGRGGLWFTGNAGIRVASLRDLDAFAEGTAGSVSVRVLGIEDGLKTLECNGGIQPAGCLARDGNLWFPTARGAVKVDPGGVSDRKALFPARIEKVLVNGRLTAPGSPVSLPRGEGALEFGFSVPSLLNPSQIQVQYRLEGFDRAWVDAGSRRTAYYTNVPAGRYVFRVKGGGDGVGEQAAFALFLAPPFYQHRLFLGAVGLLLAGGIVGAYRLRVNFIMRRSRVLEETVARRTAELTVEKDHVLALEERYRAVVEDQTEMICRFAPDGTVTLVNGAMGRFWGLDPSSLQGRNLLELFREERWRGVRQVLGTLTPQSPIQVEEQQVHALDGTPRIHQWSIRAFFDAEGHLKGFQGVGRDVTERRRMGEHLLQAQKMEAVGRLAGGVAHDFNNLLQAMLSASGTLGRTCAGCDKGAAALREVEEDIQRAAQLTRQLLLFSHKETAKPEMLDLNAVVRGVEGLLKRLLRENIRFVSVLASEPLPIRVDRGQMEQAIVNLVVNACDAMPGGGRLDLATGADACEGGGETVWLSVSDTGVGVPEEIRGQIFEPFFTTKGPEQGTGLGLPVVLGIVQQNGGAIEVGSSPDGGATFRITLPRAVGPLPEPGSAGLAVTSSPKRSCCRVLLVEDAPGVRDWLTEALLLLGYEVTSAGTAREAMEWASGQAFDLVLSDLMLPDASGADLIRQFEVLRPAPALILMSGYAGDEVLKREVLAGSVRFLQKPFGLDLLDRELGEALSKASHPSPGGESG